MFVQSFTADLTFISFVGGRGESGGGYGREMGEWREMGEGREVGVGREEVGERRVIYL